MIKIKGKGQPQWAKDMEDRILTYVNTHFDNLEKKQAKDHQLLTEAVDRLDNVEDILKRNNFK